MIDIENDAVKQQIVAETSKIAWRELQYFFASGMAIYVSEELDLIDVASSLVDDNKPMFEKWMQDKQIMPVPDEQARNWYDSDAMVWAVVIKPWVLVQQVKN
ncbi:MAG: DUF2288 domain-containing protein [Gammaproteobacteria bacterium]|nr:DUF2288 domain-containing protein [Gammaproteobacteria bacterium]MCW8922957.1 DUF2288 domain-containing protein [Gammaproteobacteria bacterium]